MANKHSPAIGSFLLIDQTQMHYVDTKQKHASNLSPIVLIHGASANLLDMKLALGEQLAKDRRVVMIDRPGHGHSDRPAKGYELAVQAQLINGVISKLDIEKPIILGQSYGGAVALNYALQYPDSLSGLVLISPVSHEWPGGIELYHHISAYPVIGPIFRRSLLPLIHSIKGKSIIDGAFWPLDPPEDYYDNSGTALVFRPANFRYDSQDRLHLLRQIKAQKIHYVEITVPTRIIAGTHDTSVSPGIHSMSLEREIPNAVLKLIPGIGHPLHHAAQEEIEQSIAELDAIVNHEEIAVSRP